MWEIENGRNFLFLAQFRFTPKTKYISGVYHSFCTLRGRLNEAYLQVDVVLEDVTNHLEVYWAFVN